MNNYNYFNIIEYSIQINVFLHEGLVWLKIRVKCKNMQRYNFDWLMVGMKLHFNDVYSYMYFFARYMKVTILFYTCIWISIDVTEDLTLWFLIDLMCFFRDSERLLKSKPVGCFLIRVSESRFGYTLSFR